MSDTEPSQIPLVEALNKIGLSELAERAANNEFHDYKSPHAMPQHMLAGELDAEMRNLPGLREPITAIRQNVIEGTYDATKEESDKWMESPEGQATFKEFIRGMKKR